MAMLRVPVLALAFSAGLVFGQVDSNSATVTASRNSTVQPDQAILSVSVLSDMNTTLNDVLAALQGSGITFANFSGVNTHFGNTVLPALPGLQWTFALATPLTNLKDTLATLASLQRSLVQKRLTLTYYVQGTQISQQLQQSQTCAIPDLIADARAKAQTLANAGGRSLGGILALSGATTTTVSLASQAYNGVFGSSPQGCSITVKFSLLGS